MPETKRAFISHASEDKGRFVEVFARRLREKGIDAWYDQWEIQPGDSIVHKIFEQGIKNADVFIVVLSQNSVEKSWVREELESGVVQRINRACRIIPVVLDDCKVPTALNHLRWEKIHDIDDYETVFQRIVNVIYGGTERPPLGPPLQYKDQSVVNFVPGLTKTDNHVFQILGDRSLKNGNRRGDIEGLREAFSAVGLSDSEVNESLEILERHGMLDSRNSLKTFDKDCGEWAYKGVFFTVSGIVTYVRNTVPNFDQLVLEVASGIVNRGFRLRLEFEELKTVPLELLEVIVLEFEAKRLIHLLLGSNGRFHQLEPNGPGLTRMLGQ
ncbi:MAG: toll/interleukin-1 receptor domain-containing protein [Verrucomicrobiae bacterium]|nr:toll/interleukin-1 receptor domain-containing protein [Verrucomicrobiae bacterium]